MKICIYGAGAIGGFIGALLARSSNQTGVEVSLIARGAHLAAIRKNGLTMVHGDERFTVHPVATDNPAELGPQDFVILALKAHSVTAIIDDLQHLLGPETAVVTAQNGVPWWYFHGQEGPLENTQIEASDPGGILWDRIGPERAIGTVVWQAAEILEPGVVELTYGDRLSLGEPAGGRSDRIQRLSSVLIDAGLKAPVRPNIRNEIWTKLWGNLSFNPVSVLTQMTLDNLVRNPSSHRIIAAMMTEAVAIGEKLGIRFPVTVDKRIEAAGNVGPHKTSMLQDLEAGRPMEIDPILGGVVELGRLTDTPTPTMDLVYDLVKARETTVS